MCSTRSGPSPYLDLDGPREVTDVHVKGNIGVASEGELLTGETVSVFLDVGFRHDGHLLPRDGPSCWGKEFTFGTLTFGAASPTCRRGAALAETYYYEAINGSTSHWGQHVSSDEQLLLCLKCIKLLCGWPNSIRLYWEIKHYPYFIDKTTGLMRICWWVLTT